MLHLGAILAHLGAILAPFGRQHAPSWRHLAPSRRHLEPSWVQLASPKLVLEPRGSRYGKVLFRGCKSVIRYAKVLFRGCKSAIRYAKTQNDLSPLWGRSDLGSLKHNTYATSCLALHSLWGPSDFFFAQVPPVEVYRLRRHSLAQLGFASLALARRLSGPGRDLPIAPES